MRQGMGMVLLLIVAVTAALVADVSGAENMTTGIPGLANESGGASSFLNASAGAAGFSGGGLSARTAGNATLDLDRASAAYGEIVRVTGRALPGAPVALLVDGNQTAAATAGPDGAFAFDYRIGRLAAGAHEVAVEAGSARSDARTLAVQAAAPQVLLTALSVVENGRPFLRCRGNVTLDNRPVAGAGVRLVFRDFGKVNCTTRDDGSFSLLVDTGEGTRTVIAELVPGDLPLLAAASSPVTATVPGSPGEEPLPTASPSPTAALPAPGNVTLDLDRSSAAYGETVRVTGRALPGAPVALLIDGNQTATATAGSDGAFAFDYRIGRLAAGAHEIAVEAGAARSDARTLAVRAAEPHLNLSVVPVMENNRSFLRCEGNATLDNRPVAGVGIRLVFGGIGTVNCTTRDDGSFGLLVDTGEGTRTVYAELVPGDLPLLAAASAPVTATVPGSFPWLLIVGGGILAIVLAGAGLFFWRRKPRPEPEVVTPASSSAPGPAPAVREDLRAVAAGIAAGPPREGIRAAYRELLRRLELRTGQKGLLSTTPRELALSCAGTPFGPALADAGRLYEEVVDAGRPATDDDRRRMIDLFVTVLSAAEGED